MNLAVCIITENLFYALTQNKHIVTMCNQLFGLALFRKVVQYILKRFVPVSFVPLKFVRYMTPYVIRLRTLQLDIFTSPYVSSLKYPIRSIPEKTHCH